MFVNQAVGNKSLAGINDIRQGDLLTVCYLESPRIAGNCVQTQGVALVVRTGEHAQVVCVRHQLVITRHPAWQSDGHDI